MPIDFELLQKNKASIRFDSLGIRLDVFINFVGLELIIKSIDERIKILETYIEMNRTSESVEEEKEDLKNYTEQKEEILQKQDKYRRFLKLDPDKKINYPERSLAEARGRKLEFQKKYKDVHVKPPFNPYYWNKQR